MSVRGCTTRLARAEKAAAARRPAGPDRPALVMVTVDEHGVGRLDSVIGPYQSCASRGWPQDAWEPFEGSEADLEAYYARHGWQPGRTVFLRPHMGALASGSRP